MKKIFAIAISIGLLIGGISFITTYEKGCVNVYVDYGTLDNKSKHTTCIGVHDKSDALTILKKANYKIQGTIKYGDAVVCRVNNLPDPSVETCETMPPADAYWAVIVKKKQVVPFPINEWGWAQKGINETYLYAGDSIGLVWADNGKVIFP
jgi:hypothetical protein